MPKKILTAAFALALLLTPVGRAEEAVATKVVPIGNLLYLDVYEAGKPSGAKVKAYFQFSGGAKGSPQASWTHIYMTPFPKEKEVGLRIERFSSQEGTIKNIQLNPDHTATFDMVPGTENTELATSRKMSVWIKFYDDDRSVLAVSGEMVFWDDELSREVDLEWKQAKERSFKLPYNAVF